MVRWLYTKRYLFIEKSTIRFPSVVFRMVLSMALQHGEMNHGPIWTMGQLSEFQIGKIVLISFCCVFPPFRNRSMMYMYLYIYGKQFGSTKCLDN